MFLWVNYWVDDGCHIDQDGIQDDIVGAFRSSVELFGVRCCSNDGSTCSTSWDCSAGTQLTFEQAETYCANEGNRLCTRAEMETDICCGGSCDSYGVWTSTSYTGKRCAIQKCSQVTVLGVFFIYVRRFFDLDYEHARRFCGDLGTFLSQSELCRDLL